MGAVVLLDGATSAGPGQALDCRFAKKASLAVTGDFVATVSFEASLDGVNFYQFSGELHGNSCTSVVTPGLVIFPDVEAVAYIRPRVQMYQRGSVTVVGYVETRVDDLMSYAHFNEATTGALVKNGSGIIHSVNIGDPGSGMSVTVYDGTSASGDVIGVFKVAGSYVLDVAFSSGLFVVITASSPGDVCIAYK